MISPSKQVESQPRRHDLATIDPVVWPVMLREQGGDLREAVVTCWADEGRPLVRRRALPGEQIGVPLGLPLPAIHGKKRVCLVAQTEAVLAWAPPPLFETVAVPEAWRSTQAAIVALGARHGVRPRVFGSFAWSALTGLPYLTPKSDLDLLVPLPEDGSVASLIKGLFETELSSPAAIDGEIVRHDGAAVHWRELHQGAAEVLVKTLDDVVLRKRSWFLDDEYPS